MPDTAPTPAPTVLVVEDEALIAMLVEQTLAEAGWRPIRSADGVGVDAAGAAAAVVGLRFEDGLDGREVVRRLRARRPALPVVVVTGFHPEAPQADLRGLGGPTLRLRKPFDCDDLARAVAAALRTQAPPPAAAPSRRRSDCSKVPA